MSSSAAEPPTDRPAVSVEALRRHWLLAAYVLIAVAVAAQKLLLHKDNVFEIYRWAFHSLLARVNLYAPHPGQHRDLFRYSPTFALLFGPIAILPRWLGLVVWDTLNAVALYAAIGRLLPRRQAFIVRLIVLGDLVRSMESAQSNALVAALMIAAYLAWERGHHARGALATAAGAAVKIFPAGAGLFALLRPGRGRALLFLLAATIGLAVLPLVVVSPALLAREYHWWLAVERAETFKPMYSVMDLADVWTGRYWARWPFQLAGLALLLFPATVRRERWDEPDFRRRLLASLLVFSVLFNHAAEAPSFVIATLGIGIWFVSTPRSRTHDVLLLLTLVLVTLGTSDLTPRAVREGFLEPSRAKVLPVLAAWVVMQVELLRPRVAAAAHRAADAVRAHPLPREA